MRFGAVALLWLLATLSLAVTLPLAWAQSNLVDVNGYARLAARAAAEPVLQEAVAAELSNQAVRLVRDRGYSLDPAQARQAADHYTAGPAFAAEFVRVNRAGHAWLLSGETGAWQIDVIPMLSDNAFAPLLAEYGVVLPASMTVPVTTSATQTLRRPDVLHRVAVWGPWLCVAAGAITVACALLMLATARRRGRAVAALGVSALLVAAAGWSGIEVGRRYLGEALDHCTVEIRRIADVVVALAEDSLHEWLDVTLAAGAAMVVAGVLLAMLGGLRTP